jgi:branched-subunit amino acid aminotransferase/4-amino-4-deoxychorismate lyase
MYSFASRPDIAGDVFDEPLYASYLCATGLDRPYKEAVMASQAANGHQVVKTLLDPNAIPEYAKPSKSEHIRFAKHIGKMKLAAGNELFENPQSKHVILLRDPVSVIKSWSRVLPATSQELSYTALLEIYSDLEARGCPPPVVLSEDVISNPEQTLKLLCLALNIPWVEEMLHWPAGPKPFDGVWASYWYKATHSSTGFSTDIATEKSESTEPFPTALKGVLSTCWMAYNYLRSKAIKPSQTSKSKETGTHVYEKDARNDEILIGIRNGIHKTFDLVPRNVAQVSVFDSGFLLGDGVWEGLRLHKGVLLFISAHIDRLFQGSKAIMMDLGLTKQELINFIYKTIDANGMSQAEGVHIRLVASRGLKPTPYQNPATTIGLPTIVVIPEYKASSPLPKVQGIRLMTSHIVRGPSNAQDPMWNSLSKLNCIAACIQANVAGVEESLMLDPHGFVATCNSVNFFIVRNGELWAPTTRYQLHGITRQKILNLASANGIPTRELDFSLTEVYDADEAFVTGTFAGCIPVRAVDGRTIGDRGPVTERLQTLYMELQEREFLAGRIPYQPRTLK